MGQASSEAYHAGYAKGYDFAYDQELAYLNGKPAIPLWKCGAGRIFVDGAGDCILISSDAFTCGYDMGAREGNAAARAKFSGVRSRLQ